MEHRPAFSGCGRRVPCRCIHPEGGDIQGLELVAEHAEHAVACAVLASLQGVVHANTHVLVAKLKTDSALPGEIVHHLSFQFGGVVQTTEAYIFLGLDVTGSRNDREVNAGLEVPVLAV